MNSVAHDEIFRLLIAADDNFVQRAFIDRQTNAAIRIVFDVDYARKNKALVSICLFDLVDGAR